jgi:hypothetical protein
MIKRWSIGFAALLFLTGCVMSPADTSEPSDNEERLKHQLGYGGETDFQKKKLASNNQTTESEYFATEKTEEIAQALMDHRDITSAEVQETEDALFIAVKLRGNISGRSHQKDVIPAIENLAREIMGNEQKEIHIWTDHFEWNEFKNDGASPDFLEKFDEFFERENYEMN